jgi:hypothetical protein
MATENEMAGARQLIAETRYEYFPTREPMRSPENTELSGWFNGKVILKDGRTFDAGGGWVGELSELVEPYNYRDAGQVDELAEALGLDAEDTLTLLRADCPKTWNNG